MRRLIFLPLILFLLTACANNNGTSSLPLPAIFEDALGESQPPQPAQAPIVQVTATSPLPPTFTPDPMAHQGHLYLLPVSGADGRLHYVHVVRPGETLSGLSKQYGVNLEVMARTNNLTDQNLIRVGMVLVVPLSGDQYP
jgi:LysM repeat protein